MAVNSNIYNDWYRDVVLGSKNVGIGGYQNVSGTLQKNNPWGKSFTTIHHLGKGDGVLTINIHAHSIFIINNLI